MDKKPKKKRNSENHEHSLNYANINDFKKLISI